MLLYQIGCSALLLWIVSCVRAPSVPALEPLTESSPSETEDALGPATSTQPEPAAEPAPAASSVPKDETPSIPVEPLPLPGGTKVLHVGDSFAGALGLPLGKLLEDAEVRSVLKHTDSSYLTDWAWDGNLQKYIWKYNPDLVIVTLGANELSISEPEQRERTVRKIISQIADRPCVWVAIPLWKGRQNGLMEVIERSSKPCVYLDTNQLLDVAAMPRISDGIHPTTAARHAWAEFVLRWLEEHRHPVDGRPWNLTP